MRGKEKYKNAEYDVCTVECLIKYLELQNYDQLEVFLQLSVNQSPLANIYNLQQLRSTVWTREAVKIKRYFTKNYIIIKYNKLQ
jgi:hypothetical protein